MFYQLGYSIVGYCMHGNYKGFSPEYRAATPAYLSFLTTLKTFEKSSMMLLSDVPTVVDTDHHSDKMTTTTNSLISTKISA